MTATLSVLVSLALTPIKIGTPVGEAGRFELPLLASKATVEKAKMLVENGQIVVFMSGVTVTPSEQALAAGPITNVRISALPKGVRFDLTPALDAKSTLERLEIVSTPELALRITQDEVGAAAADETQEEMMAQAPPLGQPERGLRFAKEGGLAKALQPAVASMAPAGGTLAIASLCCLGAIAVGFVSLRRRRERLRTGAIEGIEIVAVKPFGPKQKLALIETCGQKLLIAASDKEMRLISQIDGPKIRPEDFDKIMAQAAGPTPGPTERATTPEPEPEPTPAQPERKRPSLTQKLSQDVAGLLRLRTVHAQQERSKNDWKKTLGSDRAA